MAIKTEIQEVRQWHARIGLSERFRDRHEQRFKWKEAIEQYKGKYRTLENTVDIPLPIIQLVFAYIKTEIPRLYLRDPHIKVNPKKGSSIQSAKILELALNYIWRVKRLKRQIKKSILDGKLVGHAWFKTGYTAKFGAIEDHEGNIEEFIESEDFFGYRVPWKHMYFDVDSTNPPHDTPWLAHEFWIPLEDAKNDKRFKNTDNLQGSPKIPVNKDNVINTSKEVRLENDQDTLMVRMFEIWDIKKKQKMIIADGSEKYIQKPTKWPYKMRGYPFSYMKFHDVNDEAYGLPDIFMIQDQILERIKIRASQLDHIKRYNRQYITKPNNLQEEAKSLLSSSFSGAVIEAQEGPGSIAPIPYPPLPQDAYAVEDRVANDQILTSGQNPVESGAPARSQTRTIREVIEQQAGSENRRSEQIDIIEDFVEDISENLIGLLQQYATTPFYVSITGEDPATITQNLSTRPSAADGQAITRPDGFTFTKKDIQGEFDVDIVAGSTVPLNKGAVLEIMTQVVPFVQQLLAQPGPISSAIGNIFGELLDMPEIKIAIEQQGQLQQQRQEQQAEQLQQQRQLEAANDASQTQIQAERIQVANQKNIMNAAIEAAKLRQERNKTSS